MTGSAKERTIVNRVIKGAPVARWAEWLLRRIPSRVRAGSRPRPSLDLVQRITLAPHHTLALVEADGRRLLVATSPDGAAAFYSLDDHHSAGSAFRIKPARVSW